MRYAIQTSNLTKSYNGVKAVNNLSINVPEGCIYGFIGPNGAGKTTTLKMLTGMLRPDSGDIVLEGKKSKFGKYDQYKSIGFLSDVPEYYNWMTAREFLELSGKLFGIPSNELKKRIDELLDLAGINTNKKIKGYSRGMKQRLGIAQALINNPSIVFLDEPTSALDPLGRKEFLDLILSLKNKATVFFSTHILADVERICDRISILDKGNMLMEDSIEEIKKNFIKNKVLLKTNENQRALKHFNNLSWVTNIEMNENMILEVNDLELAKNQIPFVLSDNNLSVDEFKVIEPSLEDIFVTAVNN